MGDSNYGGNGSVHWDVDHDDGYDLKVKTNESRRPNKNDTDNVHIKKKAQGRDGSKDAVDYFEVTLRFEPQQSPSPISQLTDALAEAQKAASTGRNDSFTVTFKVPATVNGQQRAKPEDRPWPDVRVKW